MTANTIMSALGQRSYIGDFLGSGQTSIITQRNEHLSDFGYYTNSFLFAAVANNAVTTYPATNIAENNASVYSNGGYALLVGSPFNLNGGPYGTGNYLPGATNQFIWSNGSVPVNTVISRYMVRESKGTEPGGTSLGDLNGDGYTDYLMTFEGHAEICYSLGADGFDCRLMEDLTSTIWQPPTISLPKPTTAKFNTVTVGLTVSADTNGLIPNNGTPGAGVFSVLSVGHANDTNLSEVIYRRGDGGLYNNGAGTGGGNQYWVCTVRDGMKNCAPWTGPNMRPYISGADTGGFPIPGVT
jgi:hypothetical protein